MHLLLPLLAQADPGAPAYGGVGLALGITGPFLAVGGGVAALSTIGHEDQPRQLPLSEEYLAKRRRRERTAIIGGVTTVVGVGATLSGPSMLLVAGLVGAEDRSQVAGWTGVALAGTTLACVGTGIALENDDPAGILYATAAVTYVGTLVAGGIQLAVDGGPERQAVVLPIAAGRF